MKIPKQINTIQYDNSGFRITFPNRYSVEIEFELPKTFITINQKPVAKDVVAIRITNASNQDITDLFTETKQVTVQQYADLMYIVSALK